MQRWSVSMCRHVDMLERKLKIKLNKLLLDTNLYVPYFINFTTNFVLILVFTNTYCVQCIDSSSFQMIDVSEKYFL